MCYIKGGYLAVQGPFTRLADEFQQHSKRLANAYSVTDIKNKFEWGGKNFLRIN